MEGFLRIRSDFPLFTRGAEKARRAGKEAVSFSSPPATDFLPFMEHEVASLVTTHCSSSVRLLSWFRQMAAAPGVRSGDRLESTGDVSIR